VLCCTTLKLDRNLGVSAMNRPAFLSAACLLCASVPAGAVNWIQYGAGTYDEIQWTRYADMDRNDIKVAGHRVTVRLLMDLSQPMLVDEYHSLSRLAVTMVDCKTKQATWTFDAKYSGNMATGDLLFSRNVHEQWHLNHDAQVPDALFQSLCRMTRQGAMQRQ